MNRFRIIVGDIVKIINHDCLISDDQVMICYQKCGCRDVNRATVISKTCNNEDHTFGIKFENGEICARNNGEIIPLELDTDDEFFGLCPQCDSANIEPIQDGIYDPREMTMKAVFTCYNCDYDFEVVFKGGVVTDESGAEK